MKHLTISGLRHSAFYSPLLYTIGSGLLEAEGLQPHYDPTIPVAEGIRSGRVHLAQSAVAASFAELESGQTPDIVHFAQINERDGFFIATREIDKDFHWSKLAGKKVLVDHFFQPMAMFRYACFKQGVDFKTIDVVDAGDVNQIDAAFREGTGDYVHQQGPAPQQLEHEGIAHVIASVGEAIGPVAFSSLCASRQWLNTDEAKAFMRAYRQGRKAVIERPAAEIADVVSAFLPEISRAVLEQTIASYQQLGTWSPEVEISKTAYENLLDVFQYSGLITERYAYDRAIVCLPDGDGGNID